MDKEGFFEAIVEPSVERLAQFGLAHDVSFDGRAFVVSHKISRNVMTEFDAALSKYLAAVTGVGMPGAMVETRIKDVETGRAWAPYPARHAASVTEALSVAAKLALGSDEEIRVRFGPWHGEDQGHMQGRTINQHALATYDEALWITRQFGAPEFLDMSGDYDRIMLRPAGSDLEMMILDLFRGAMSIPSRSDAQGSSYQGPLYSFSKAMQEAPALISHMAQVTHIVATKKEDAIRDFRRLAEERIGSFSEAVAGRVLDGYLMESAKTLVVRLQTGLGDSLLGLSEEAQVRALDWAMHLRQHSVPHIAAPQGSDEGNNNPPPKGTPRLVS